MKIAVDAMGGDFAPREIVLGALHAAENLADVTKIILVGDPGGVKSEIDASGIQSSKVEIFPASEVVAMDEAPAQAVRRKKDSSIGRAVDLVKGGDVDAVVSAGNTGAVVVASSLKLRTLEGVERPAIAAVMPSKDKPFVLLDAGANPECDAKMLAQFAMMGDAYSRVIMGQKEPTVGLLSIGGEDTKGNDTTKQAFRALQRSGINFQGNVEANDLFMGETDVAVCDGFVGNVVLKCTESVARAIGQWMKQEFMKNPVRISGAVLLKGAMKAMKQRMDPETYGGALLLGVNGICIITHGASSSRAISNAIRVASESVHHHLNEMIVNSINGMKEWYNVD